MTEAELIEIDAAELSDVVQRTWGRPVAGPDAWTCTPLGATATVSTTRGLWRVRSTSTSAGQPDWSLVLKVLRHSARGHKYWLSSDDVADPMYWKREALLYSTDFLRSFTGGLRGPHCHGLRAHSSGEIHLWLEDVSGVPGASWTLAEYRVGARQLGRAQGEFLSGRSLPDWPWLSRGWLRSYVERRDAELSVEPPSARWNGPLVRTAFPEPVWEPAARVWRERERFLGLLEQLPRTLCHEDFWPRNLFLDGASPESQQTIVIDWAFAGIGAVGEDAGNLIPDSMLDLFMDGRSAAVPLTEAIFEEYTAGLREAGAKLPSEIVRFALTATAGLKYLWMIPRLVRSSVADAGASAQEFGVSVEDLYAQRGAVMRHMLALADEARNLIPDVTRFLEAYR